MVPSIDFNKTIKLDEWKDADVLSMTEEKEIKDANRKAGILISARSGQNNIKDQKKVGGFGVLDTPRKSKSVSFNPAQIN